MQEREYGRLFMVGFYGTAFCPELEQFIEAINPCGVILFSRNILEPRQVAELNFSIQDFAINKLGRPLLIGVDQEGGRVTRLKSPFTQFPPAMALASDNNPEKSLEHFASKTATELRLAGFNLDFIPVLDVLGEGIDHGGTVIGDRSFGSSPKQVADLGRIVIETFKSHGLLSCPKHFPGHGAVSVDSHLELPVDERNEEIIRQRDLIPFQSAINHGPDLIMTAHVRFPALDADYPASLSPRIVGELLKKEMRFAGPVATDDLDMGAISKYYTVEEASLLAYQAGSDILLVCNSPEKVFSAKEWIFRSMDESPRAAERLKKSLSAVEKLFPRIYDLHKHCDMASLKNYFGASFSLET